MINELEKEELTFGLKLKIDSTNLISVKINF